MKKLLLILDSIRQLEKNDVLLLSFPKSGNTYVRILYCNYIRLSLGIDDLKGFDELNTKMPELGVTRLDKKFFYKFPVLLKSHRFYIAKILSNRRLILKRNKVDTIVSFYQYEMSRKNVRNTTLTDWIIKSDVSRRYDRFYNILMESELSKVVHYEDLFSLDSAREIVEYILGEKIENSALLQLAYDKSSREIVGKWSGKDSRIHQAKHNKDYTFASDKSDRNRLVSECIKALNQDD